MRSERNPDRAAANLTNHEVSVEVQSSGCPDSVRIQESVREAIEIADADYVRDVNRSYFALLAGSAVCFSSTRRARSIPSIA
jgi:hypothetical protein